MSKIEDLRGIFGSLKGGIEVIKSAVEDEGKRNTSLEKRCRFPEESISNLKPRDESEG